MLSNFQSNDRSLIQSFLLGQPEFRNMLQSQDMQQLRQRVIASYHLGPLDAIETRAYIEHRLRTVGWKGFPSFSDDAFETIYQFTGGIPRRVNTFCDRLLLYGFLEEKSAFDSASVKEVIEDLRHEVANQDASGNEITRASMAVIGAAPAMPADLLHLTRRVEQIERSLNRMLPIVRKILFMVSEKDTPVADLPQTDQ